MALIKETQDMDDTAPANANGARYVGPPVNPKTGELVCPKCGKPFSECECNDDEDLHTTDVPDDVALAKRGLGAAKEEAYMDFSDNLSELLLEEYLPEPVKKVEAKPIVEDAIVEEKQTFSEQYLSYVQKQGDQLGRKPSDVPVRPAHNPMIKLLYSDHMPQRKNTLR